MRKSAALLLVLVFLMASCIMAVKPVSAASQDSWALKAPMHMARGGLGVAVVNGKIYAIGGSTVQVKETCYVSGGVVDVNEEYDSATDTWTTRTPMPTPRAFFAVAVYQNKIYCIGGFSGFSNISGATENATCVNEVYDPATDIWTTRSPMPTATAKLHADVVNGKIYLLGGKTKPALNQVYDPENDSWATRTSIPDANFLFGSAVVDSKIYALVGFSGKIGFNSKIEIYDPATDNWSPGAIGCHDFNSIVAATTGIMAPKRIYVLSGWETMATYSDGTGSQPFGDTTKSNQIYDPKNDSWTLGAAKPTDRIDFGVAVVNDMLYVIGGIVRRYPITFSWGLYDDTPTAVNEQYTPVGYGTPDPSYVPPDSIMPEISVMSPENETCYTTNVPLSFTVNESDTWMRYKLDGKTVVEVEGNSTLAGLSAGLHNITIFVTDAAGNTAASETIYFTVDDTAPVVSVTAPENKTYKAAEVPLNFTVNEKVSRMEYSLDSQPNVQITGNTTLTGLSNGAHNLTVYARDVAGNTGVSEIIYFSVDVPEPFPVALVAVASVAIVVVAGVGLLVYFKKRKH
jgi:hypothetical protein